jgi:anti-sigma B factor antagonist
MRFDLNNPYLLIEPVYGDVVITFKDSRIVDENHIRKIEADILQLGESQPGKNMTLDFKNVQFMSSAALGFLVKLQKTITLGRGSLNLRNMSKQIYEVFKITNLYKIFTIEKVKSPTTLSSFVQNEQIFILHRAIERLMRIPTGKKPSGTKVPASNPVSELMQTLCIDTDCRRRQRKQLNMSIEYGVKCKEILS